jgi:NADPH:quinone reductase-like Zn-dependent oxidoreductase
MKALFINSFGGPEVIQYGDLPDPVLGNNQVLVKVKAASVNPVDNLIRSGRLKFITGSKFPRILGVDFSGTVTEIGSNVKGFKIGDSVYGATNALSRKQQGAFSESLAVLESHLRLIPLGYNFEDAACLPVAGITAISGLNKCMPFEGKSVLVIGATGGVGHFAVQIAKARGAKVTGVCKTSNMDIAKKLGCENVIDYTNEDFLLSNQRYDVIYDSHGGFSFSAIAKLLHENGQYVTPTLYPPKLFGAFFRNITGKKKFLSSNMQPVSENYAAIENLVKAGLLRPVIEQIFALPKGADALKLVEQGKVRGKVVVKI